MEITETEFLEYITPDKSALGDQPKALEIYKTIHNA